MRDFRRRIHMPTNDSQDMCEQQRRIDAAIARASGSQMSNTKWRRLFRLLQEMEVRRVLWKFIGDERIFDAPPPMLRDTLDDSLGDVLPYPYGPYREIEWIEIPAEHARDVENRLGRIGRFPLQQVEDRLRVPGYVWS